MANVKLFDQTGKEVSTVELNDAIFGIEPNESVVFDVVISQRASLRQGTHAVKNRSAVSGGGRKPWRQKGTGRARQGSIRSPQWRGGGVVFAPTPRSHAIKVNKKVVRLAMRCALSTKVRENNIVVLDQIVLDTFKTKGLVEVLKAFNLENNKVVLVLAEANGTVELAGRNIPNVLVQQYNHVSVFQMMNAKNLVITKAAVEKFEEVLK